MQIETLLMANVAGIENGLLSAEGAGWEHYVPAFLPCTVRGAVCGVATLDESELGSTPALKFRASAQDGQSLGWSASMTIDGVRVRAPEGVPTRVPFVVTLTAVVRNPTVITITLTSDSEELAATSFAVRDPVPDAPPPT